MSPDSFDLHANDPEAAERAVALLKALSHVGRLRILCSLLDRPMSVTDLCIAVGEHQAAVSQHLMRLRAEGLVTRHRVGKTVEYRMQRADVTEVIASLRRAFC